MPVSEAILVGIRLRPLNAREQGQKLVTTCEGNVVHVVSADKSKQNRFQMDAAMDSSIDRNSPNYWTQERVYDFFGKRMIEHALQGYHSAIFAYGQTGTGKTTTVMGDLNPPSEHGLLLRLLADFMTKGEEIRENGGIASLKIQMLEVYNEKVKDLLSPNASVGGKEDKNKLDIHVHPQHGVYVKNSVESEVSELNEAFKLIDYGNTMKTVAATAMNKQSSRAHTVVKLYVETKEGGSSSTRLSEVFVVDLAGRENERTTLVTGERLVELTFINRSLLWLSSCITALGRAKPKTSKEVSKTPRDQEADAGTVPAAKAKSPKTGETAQMAKFRNSKLTLLLYNALSGNSRTAMVGTLSPAECNFEETMSTMNFASTVKSIKLEASSAVSVNKDDLVKQLKAELQQIKENMIKNKSVDEAHLNSVNHLLHRHSTTSGEIRKEIDENNTMREQAMRRLDFTRSVSGRNVFAGTKTPRRPYLAKRSDDPALNGKIRFHVPVDTNFSIGTGRDCNFQIAGLGMTELTCILYHDSRGSLFIRAGCKMVEVGVNGEAISEQPTRLRSGDIITLGHAHDFDVFTHEESPRVPEDEPTLVRSDSRKLSYASQNNMRTTIFRVIGPPRNSDRRLSDEAKEYYKTFRDLEVLQRGSTTAWNSWIANASKVSKLVAEANAITRGMAGSLKNIEFQLEMEAPIMTNGFGYLDMPQFCVRMVKKMARSRQLWNLVKSKLLKKSLSLWAAVLDQQTHAGIPDPKITERESGQRLICIWSLGKFRERLDQMRQIYEEFHDNPHGFDELVLFNPWIDFGPVEKMEYDTKARHQVDTLRNKRDELRSRVAAAKARREDIQRKESSTMASTGKVPSLMLEPEKVPVPESSALASTGNAPSQTLKPGKVPALAFSAVASTLESSALPSKTPRSTLLRCQSLIAHNSKLIDQLARASTAGI